MHKPQTTRDVWHIELTEQRDVLLAVCQEIAGDSRCDLVDSERRIRLYAAITKAGGEL